MPKRNRSLAAVRVDPYQSTRWPNFFKDVDKASLFLQHPEWELMCLDLEQLADDEAAQILDRWPENEAELGRQNFQRGYIAGLKEILGLSEELKKWKEERRK